MWGMWESNPLNKPNQLPDITNTRIRGKNRRTSTLIIYIISILSRFTNLKYYNFRPLAFYLWELISLIPDGVGMSTTEWCP